MSNDDSPPNRSTAETGGPAGAPAGGLQSSTILRFSRASRLAHWTLGVPFVVLVATGLLLFVPELKAVHIGGQRLVALIHVLTGIFLIAALFPVYVLQPGKRSLYADLGRLVHFDRGDLHWFHYEGYALLGAKLKQPPTGKFNAGQKANTIASAVFTAGLILTGIVLAVNYFTKSVFGSAFVEQVYPFHDYFTTVAVPIVAGHIVLATLNPGTNPSLRGMFDGRVRRDWARSHHSTWVREREERGSEEP